MKALQNTLVFVISLFSCAPVFAQGIDDSKIIERYCLPQKGGKSGEFIYKPVPARDDKGEEIIIKRAGLKCVKNNERFFFESTNARLKISNADGLAPDFFKSAPWQKYMKERILIELMKSNSECTEVNIVAGEYMVKCGDTEIPGTKIVEAIEAIYTRGKEAFASDPDKIQLKEVCDAKTIFPKKEEIIKKEEEVVTGNDNNIIVKGAENNLPGDNTILSSNKVINLPQQQNLTNYKFSPKKMQHYEIKVPEFSYSEYLKSQQQPLFPDYAAKFKESLPELSYLEFGSDSEDIFSKYSLPDDVINWKPKNEYSNSFGIKLKPYETSTTNFLGNSGANIGSGMGFDRKDKFELHKFDLNTGYKFGEMKSFGDIPQKTSFGLNNTGFGSSNGFMGSSSLYGRSLSGSTLPSSTIKVGNDVADNGLDKKDENPVKTDNDNPENKTGNDDVVEDPNCDEELSKALTALLEQDGNNIIGLQYELTVLKVASAVVGNKNITLEGMIRQKTKAIADTDKDKIIEQMGTLYKKHGLLEDQKEIDQHLKTKYENMVTKGASANYYAGDKRFFNEESSAFLMAYQHLNPESGIKEADISVLWFMDKVSEKAKGQWSKLSAGHNLTNLSTRVAHYTGGINPDKAISKEKLDEMVKGQKSKIDKELLALIEAFKTNNKLCYDKLFSEGENDCNLGVVEENLSKLLAINAKIASTEQISLDNYLKGSMDTEKLKARFKLSRYVEESAK